MLGDSRLVEETSKAFKKDKKLVKGIAFPTCISVNNCICHFSPLTTEPDVTIADGDMVKIDLGAHIDGFIAVVAHTLVVGASGEAPVTGKKADAMLAAHLASEAALRLVKPGNETYEVTKKSVEPDFLNKMNLTLNLISRLPRPFQRSARLLIARCFFKCHKSKSGEKVVMLPTYDVQRQSSHRTLSQPVEGMLSHQLEQNRIDSEKSFR